MFFLVTALLPVALAIVAVAYMRRVRARAAAAEASAGWPALVVGNLLVLLTLASAAFLAFETYYRFVFDETNWWGVGLVQERWFRRHWHENAMGARDDIEYAAARGDRPRVTFLGDSFTTGHGVKDVERRFLNIVRRERPGWEVHAMAYTGADTTHETGLVEEAASGAYDLDTVVLVYCLNDINSAHPRSGDVLERILSRVRVDSFLTRNSYAVDTLYRRHLARTDPEVEDYYEFVRSSYTGLVWREQERRLDALRHAVEKGGGRLLVVTFPFLDSLGEAYAHRPAHRVLAEYWERHGVPHLDLLPAFIERASEDLVVSGADSHPNEAAHAIAAEAMLDFLDRQVR